MLLDPVPNPPKDGGLDPNLYHGGRGGGDPTIFMYSHWGDLL